MKRRGFLNCLAAVPVAVVAKISIVDSSTYLNFGSNEGGAVSEIDYGETFWIGQAKRKPTLCNNDLKYIDYINV